MPPFKVVSDFAPAGDQANALEALSEGVRAGARFQTLLGITGSGKSATIAWTTERVQRPTLVIGPNKSLAAQLANEFREFFPENRVEYFVSYYDYYQPEAYLPSSDTYIEKDSSINDEIERLRHSATSGLLARNDIVVVASVSCIYGLGSPEEYAQQVLRIVQGSRHDQRYILSKLVDMQYERNDLNFIRGKFRVRGDTIEIFPAYEENAVRLEMFGDDIERVSKVDPLTGEVLGEIEDTTIFPATEHGCRRPSAGDHRPVRFAEFYERLNQCVFLSATPSPYEIQQSSQVVEQIVRPTGLVDPEVIVKPTKGQIDDLIEQINQRVTKGDRVLVTTLTKKMAEDLTDYLLEMGVRVRYLHSEVDTIQRIEILRDLRLGEFDVLVGINLLREGLDLPEVSLVAILDADKEGFLRSETSLIQTIGRAARNVDGQVIMYADQVTDSMQRALGETNRRRGVQQAYNAEHGIDPQTIRKAVTDILAHLRPDDEAPRLGKDRRSRRRDRARSDFAELPQDELARLIRTLEEEMREAATDLRFEYAARLRGEIHDLKRELREVS